MVSVSNGIYLEGLISKECGLFIDTINLSRLGAGSSDVKPVKIEALTDRNLVSETDVYEAGTVLG